MTSTTLQIFTNQMTYYGSLIILVVGIIGCCGNFLTFTSRQLRNNSCAFYFLCASVFELFSICFGLLTRFAADHLGSDLQNQNTAYCKLRAYLVTAIPLTATYLVLLSAFDRFMSSSANVRYRSFSQMKIAYRSVIVAICLSFLSCSHILISYNLRPRCSTLRGHYAIFDGMFVVLWLGILPHGLMLIFGFLTLNNIRKSRQRRLIQNQSAKPNSRPERKTDGQLIVMMLVQVGLSSFLILTRMIYYAYYILGPPLTGEKRALGSFLMSFTTLLYYLNYAKSFFVYTLSSRLFRSVFIYQLRQGFEFIRDRVLLSD